MKKSILLVTSAAIVLAACSPMNTTSTTSPTPSPVMMDETGLESTDTTATEGVLVGGAMMVPNKDIVDNAVNSADHTTLVAAVQEAQLVETLKGPGPFTVFAPTNAAFEKLPEGTVDTLLMPENRDQLTSILTYHVVLGRFTSADLTNGQVLTTVNGETITLTERAGQWYINDSVMITVSDAISSNGVTHVIDTVLMPE